MTGKDIRGFRDAIRIPYIIVTCNDPVRPGDKVSLRDGNTCILWECENSTKWHGVVDPFLENTVEPGVCFHCFIRRECFSGWTHQFTIEVREEATT